MAGWKPLENLICLFCIFIWKRNRFLYSGCSIKYWLVVVQVTFLAGSCFFRLYVLSAVF